MIRGLLELFFVFFKIGAMSFGGGYAMIPFLSDEVLKRGWLTQSNIVDMIAVSQVTPGPIATNMATFVGYNNYKFIGAIFATIGVTAPAVILGLLITNFIIDKLTEEAKTTIFYGIRPSIAALIFLSAVTIPYGEYFRDFQGNILGINFLSIFLTIFAFVLIKVFKVNSIKALLSCGVLCVIYNLII